MKTVGLKVKKAEAPKQTKQEVKKAEAPKQTTKKD